MSQLEPKIYTVISGAAAVAAVVSTRIYPVVLPQDVALPAISYSRISGGQINSLTGYSNLESPRIQVDVWGETYSSVKSLAADVHTAMDGATTFGALLESDMDMYEDDTKIHRVSMDFIVWNN